MGRERSFVAKKGQTFQDLYIKIIDDAVIKKGHNIFYKVKCLNCGKEYEKASHTFIGENKTSCQCSKTIKGAYNFSGYEQISSIYFNRVKERAIIRNIPFFISKENIWEKFLEQDCKCALTGLPIIIQRNHKKYNKMTASLDRIDSDLPYTVDNIQWVHKDINKMKNNFKEDYFIKMCKLIVKWKNKK